MAETYINAQDLTEDVSLDGEEQFVMFDTVSGKRAKLKNIKTFINDQKYAEHSSTSDEAVGATQLLGRPYKEDATPYTFRKTGGDNVEAGKAEVIDKIVGGSVAFNQMTPNGDFASETLWAPYNAAYSVSNHVATVTKTGGSGDAMQLYQNLQLVTSHKYLVTVTVKPSIDVMFSIRLGMAYIMEPCVAGKTVTLSQIFGGQGGEKEFNAFGAIDAASGTTVDVSNAMCVDLTQMFGSTIADAIYAMEKLHAGDGVAWFRKYFPNSYYPYSTGSIESTEVTEHITTGFNQWDEEWETGWVSTSTGANQNANDAIRSKNYIRVAPNTSYHISTAYTASNQRPYFHWYDADKNWLGYKYAGDGHNSLTEISPANAAYLKFSVANLPTPVSYNHDICINFSCDRNGEYEPSTHRSYAFDDALELRGIPKLDSRNRLYYDGDEYNTDGTVVRKYGIVDLGTLTWGLAGGIFFQSESLRGIIKPPANNNANANCVSTVFTVVPWNSSARGNGIMAVSGADDAVPGKLSCQYTSASTAADFKSAMNGVYLVYELATPTTESVAPFTNVQACSKYGTEEFVTNTVVPVMANTKYLEDTAEKLAVSDGYYDEMTVRGADHLTGSYTEESVPYTFRQTAGGIGTGGVKDECIVGGSVAWNQLNNWTDTTDSMNGITFTRSNGSHVSFSGTPASGATYVDFLANYDSSFLSELFKTGHKYVITTSDPRVYFVGNNPYTDTAARGSGMYAPQGAPSYFFVRLSLTEGQAMSGSAYVHIHDLTQMFGSAVADYIYNLEQSSAGAGVALFKSMFPEAYYEYNAGGMSSVEGLQKHVTSGFNQFDKSTVVDGKYVYNGSEGSNSNFAHSDYIRVFPSTTYYSNASATGSYFTCVFYDSDKNFIGDNRADRGGADAGTFTTPANAYYAILNTDKRQTAVDDLVFNLSGDRNGEYEPYKKHSYALDSSLVLRGVPKVVDGKICFDGDEYRPDGTVNRRYGVVDLGTLDWTEDSNGGHYHFFSRGLAGGYVKTPSDNWAVFNGICSKYPSASANDPFVGNITYCIGVQTDGSVVVYDPSYEGASASTFKAAMSGVYLVYELATPSTETAYPYPARQSCDGYGTEEFVSISIVPVGHKTKYYDNLTKRIVDLPSAIAPVERFNIASTNYAVGDYLIMNDKLYKVTSAIATGGKITVGTNVTSTTIMAEIKALQ